MTTPDSAAPIPDPAIAARVATMLAAAGLPVRPAELVGFVEAYPNFAQGIDSLYAIPDARYEVPALNFTASPAFADWSEVG